MSPKTAKRPLRAARGILALTLASLAPLACSDATDVEILTIDGTGVVFGQAFLDFDGNGVPSTGDEPIGGVDVILVTSTNAEVVLLTTTDSLGIFTLFEVPVGTYRLTLDSTALADSLEVLGSGVPLTIELGDTTLTSLGVTYPVRTIEELLAEQVGRQYFTSGIALNQRLNFDPTGQVHFAGDSLYLRALNVDRATIFPGDSLRLLGRLVLDNGRPALDAVRPRLLVNGASLPLAKETTAAGAATAEGGAIDAALVRVRDLEVADTSTNLDGDFRFWGVNGADSVEVVIRSFLGLNTSSIRPDSTIRVQAVGLLSPVDDGGTTRWRILPRSGSDISFGPAPTATPR